MSVPLCGSNRHKYGEYRAWPEDQRYALIDGVTDAMAPAPTSLQQRFLAVLLRMVAESLEGQARYQGGLRSLHARRHGLSRRPRCLIEILVIGSHLRLASVASGRIALARINRTKTSGCRTARNCISE